MLKKLFLFSSYIKTCTVLDRVYLDFTFINKFKKLRKAFK